MNKDELKGIKVGEVICCFGWDDLVEYKEALQKEGYQFKVGNGFILTITKVPE